MTPLHNITGLGIRPRSMSMVTWRWTSFHLPWKPCITARVLLGNANLSFVMQAITGA